MSDYIKLGCVCYQPGHIISAQKDDKFVYLSVSADNFLPWYKRIIIAFKYVFGITYDNTQMYDCVMLADEERNKLIDFLKD